jgi:hypothetical protein
MMEKMQIEYKQQKYPHPPLDSVKEGELYAAPHHDGHWYRYVATFNLHIMAHRNTWHELSVAGGNGCFAFVSSFSSLDNNFFSMSKWNPYFAL